MSRHVKSPCEGASRRLPSGEYASSGGAWAILQRRRTGWFVMAGARQRASLFSGHTVAEVAVYTDILDWRVVYVPGGVTLGARAKLKSCGCCVEPFGSRFQAA